MSKKSKKRNKPYTGQDAAVRPTVHKYHAVVRSPLAQWWQDHKKQAKIIAMVGGGGIIFIYFAYEVIKLIFNIK